MTFSRRQGGFQTFYFHLFTFTIVPSNIIPEKKHRSSLQELEDVKEMNLALITRLELMEADFRSAREQMEADVKSARVQMEADVRSARVEMASLRQADAASARKQKWSEDQLRALIHREIAGKVETIATGSKFFFGDYCSDCCQKKIINK